MICCALTVYLRSDGKHACLRCLAVGGSTGVLHRIIGYRELLRDRNNIEYLSEYVGAEMCDFELDISFNENGQLVSTRRRIDNPTQYTQFGDEQDFESIW
jgi:hypothetical protein